MAFGGKESVCYCEGEGWERVGGGGGAEEEEI